MQSAQKTHAGACSRSVSVVLLDEACSTQALRSSEGYANLPTPASSRSCKKQASEHACRAMLQHGADTCLVKPVDIDVLVPSVHDLLRRVQGATPRTAGWTDAPGWRIEAHGWDLVLPDGKTLQLTHGECLLLEALSTSPGKPVRYEAIPLPLRRRHAPLRHATPEQDGRPPAPQDCRTHQRTLPLTFARGVGYVLHADLLPHRA
jgi:hypothetical protein